ncbi:MAG: glycosyltransferase family 39 protein [Burkholderiales bacterium]|nr:glycosyltransferase family 39 protein [Burkholderiales bacterium]
MLASLPHRTWWLLALVVALAWFGSLDVRRLQHPDEGRYGEIAREMAAGGDWVTPRLNDLKYFEKPPLQYWVGAAVFNAFGVNEWTARLPSAVAGFLAVIAVGFTAARLAGPDAGAYAALVLAGSVWHLGMSQLLTLDSLLSLGLAAALCAFLLAQRPALSAAAQRNWMLAAYIAAAAATLTKGLVALAIPGATLILYTLVTRDTGPWRRLHAVAGTLVYLALTAPWFILVSRANPEFAQFFFVHEHYQRFLTEAHNRSGEWYYFVRWFVLGIMPWLLIWAWTLPRSWRDAEVAANGFAWERFCVVWAAFVFVFFSLSGSKLPSYILPLFPALALVLGYELTRLSPRVLAWIALPLAVGAPSLLVAKLLGYEQLVASLASPVTPASVYMDFGAWLNATLASFAAGGIAAFALFRNGSAAAKTWGIAALSLSALIGMQLALVGYDAFARVRSAWYILQDAKTADARVLDPALPVFQVGSYDQTLPFYLGRPTPLVDYRDEMGLGLDAEPQKGHTLAAWIDVWNAAPQAFALMSPAMADELAARGVDLRILARDPRRVFVARRATTRRTP